MADKLTASQQAALNTSIHISLAANAGSGKTFVLKKRYAELLTRRDIFPQNIAAITFTEKAASELYTKIREEIEGYIRNTDIPAGIRNDLKKKKRLLSSARISTIHSFCSEILREFAIDAGVDPGFIPVDEVMSSEILEKAAGRSLQKSFDDPELHEVQVYLQLTLGGYNKLKSALISAVRKRGKLIPYYRNLVLLREEEFLDNADRYMGNIMAEILNTNYASEDQTGNVSLHDEQAVALYKDISSEIDKGKSGSASETPSDLATVREMHKRLYEFNLKFSRLFSLTAEYYESGKRELNFLDHDDLILKARDIVMNQESEVSSHLNQKYRYIMIDEYQDTDDAQFDIFVSKLREMTAPEPNLFIVGDEKQSIYMFRNAEPQIFRETREMIGNINKEGVITLAESFRMSRELCAFNNALFGQVFADQMKPFNSVAPEELIYARNEEPVIPPSHIEILLSTQQDDKKSSIAQKKMHQAELIAKRINKLLQDKSVEHLSDIGILLYENEDALFLQEVFGAYGIHHIFSGRTTQFRDQVTADIINLFKFAADQKNDTALTGLLRSPFFMLSDVDIYQIASGSGFYLWHRFEQLDNLSAAAAFARSYLKGFLKKAKAISPSRLLREVLSETRYIEISSAILPPEELFARIRSVSERIRVFEDEQNFTLYDLIVYLEGLRETKGKEDPVFSQKGSDAVNIMTIHASKGLEFRAVFLFNSAKERKGGSSDPFIISPFFGLIPKFPLGENDIFPLAGSFEQYLRRRRELEETKRIYYVACTRATDQIFFTADASDKTESYSLFAFLTRTFALEPADSKKTITHPVKVLSRPSMEHVTEQQNFVISIHTDITTGSDSQTPEDNSSFSGPVPLAGVTRLESTKHLSTRMIPVSGILTYDECPHKYRLVNELRLTNVTSLLDEEIPLPLSPEENSDVSPLLKGALYGSIIHKAIELYTPGLDAEDIKRSMTGQFHQLRISSSSIKDKIFSDVLRIVHSPEFQDFYSADGISEYEIRAIIGGYFVTARLDYLLLKGKNIIIADYKTNELKNLTAAAMNRYQFQLDIYALLAGKLFPDAQSVETILYITRDPARSVRKQHTRDDFIRTEQRVSLILQNIFSREQQQSFTACSDCILKMEGLTCEQFFDTAIS